MRESAMAAELAKQNGLVISTGGGVIKNKANIDALRMNGVLFFIDRDLSLLISTDKNRPLSSSKEAVEKMYAERIALYRSYADAIIDNNDAIETAVESILKQYEECMNKALSR